MRLLAFLLLGTLIFGFAFPAAILIIGLFAGLLFILMIVGILRGGMFKVYTSKGYDQFNGSRPDSTADNPEVIDTAEYDNSDPYFGTESQQEASEEDQEGEIVELPATALRKED